MRRGTRFYATGSHGMPVLECSDDVHAFVIDDEPGLVACQCKQETRYISMKIEPTPFKAEYELQWVEMGASK